MSNTYSLIKKQSLSILFFFFSITPIFSQLNLDSVSHLDYQALHGANLNDVWGYVDEFGNEYAIVGTTIGTSVVDLSDPNNPTEIFGCQGTNPFGVIQKCLAIMHI